jgi:hypothetical protein
MSEGQTTNVATENGEAEKKRRISCDYPGKSKFTLFVQVEEIRALTCLF